MDVRIRFGIATIGGGVEEGNRPKISLRERLRMQHLVPWAYIVSGSAIATIYYLIPGVTFPPSAGHMVMRLPAE